MLRGYRGATEQGANVGQGTLQPFLLCVFLHKQAKHWYIGTNDDIGLYILRLILINVYKSYTCYCPYLYQSCTKPVPNLYQLYQTFPYIAYILGKRSFSERIFNDVLRLLNQSILPKF